MTPLLGLIGSIGILLFIDRIAEYLLWDEEVTTSDRWLIVGALLLVTISSFGIVFLT